MPDYTTMMQILTHDEARRFYDAFGAKQDGQQFYEGRALADLVPHLELANARSVIELGCGTGRFAAELLGTQLTAGARSLGHDSSDPLVRLARARVAAFGARAEIRKTDGTPRLDAADASCDRFLSTYVLDLLSADDIGVVLAEAHRVTTPGGRLGLVSLTHGCTAPSRALMWIWARIHGMKPALVGGCRPLRVGEFLAAAHWRVQHRNVVTPFAIPSEIIVAERL